MRGLDWKADAITNATVRVEGRLTKPEEAKAAATSPIETLRNTALSTIDNLFSVAEGRG